MNKKGNAIFKFMLMVFVFLLFLGLSPMLASSIGFSTDSMSCDVDYTLICFIVDASLPILGVALIVGIIGLLKSR
jgi:hypothetical protein